MNGEKGLRRENEGFYFRRRKEKDGKD